MIKGIIQIVTANSRPIAEEESEVWIYPLMTVG
jgi:hypothetical protein